MQKLSITKRIADIGGQIVNRTQMHGKKEKVPAVSIPILGIILTEDEFGIIMRDANAYECFFTAENGQVMEPRFPGMEVITISDVFEGAKVTLILDDSPDPLVLKPAKVGGISIDRKGAQPIMRCMVSGVPDVHLQTLTLLNKKCRVSILNGALADRSENQKELVLPGGGPNVSVENNGDVKNETLADVQREEDEATQAATSGESSISRQIRRTEAKKARGSKPKARTKRDP